MLLNSQSNYAVDTNTLLRIFIAVSKPKPFKYQPIRKHHNTQFFG